MKFNCSYTELLDVLGTCASVVEDSLSSEDMKNIIFKLEKGVDSPNRASVVGVNQVITFIQPLDPDLYVVEFNDGEVDEKTNCLYLQIKCKELLNFFNAYKVLRRTKVEEVCFSFNSRGGIICTMLEKDIEDEGKLYTSRYVFINMPVKASIRNSLSVVAPEDSLLTTMTSVNLAIYTKSLLPILMGSSQTSTTSKLSFGEDFVVARRIDFTTLMSNKLEGDIFRGINLSQRVLSFVDKIIAMDEYISVARLPEYIYLRTSINEIFVKYDTRPIDYKNYVEVFKKNNALVLDRIYLKDVLKRLSLDNDTIEFYIDPEAGLVELKNSKFDQELQILQEKNLSEIGKIKFRVMPDVLAKAIIGSDDEFTSDVFVYFCKSEQSMNIVFADDTGIWFSIIRVKVQIGV